MWKVEENPPISELNKLTQPPQVIKYQQKHHAVFDYGGLQFLFVVSKQSTAFPTCNAVQSIGKELMVVTSDPFGYVFFVEKDPVAFKTEHNPIWNELIKKSCEGCE
jgi:hypothetical protein